jgi:hypothetical protein
VSTDTNIFIATSDSRGLGSMISSHKISCTFYVRICMSVLRSSSCRLVAARRTPCSLIGPVPYHWLRNRWQVSVAIFQITSWLGFLLSDERERLALGACRLGESGAQPRASFKASSFAQECRKNSRGCSSSMWLWTAVTSMPIRSGSENCLHQNLNPSPQTLQSSRVLDGFTSFLRRSFGRIA